MNNSYQDERIEANFDNHPYLQDLAEGENRFYAWLNVLAISFLVVLVILVFSVTFSSGSGNILLVSDFTDGTQNNHRGDLSKNWTLKVWRGRPDVKLIGKSGERVLRLRSEKASISVFREMNFDSKDLPILKWRWKVTELPKNANARFANRDDQAAGIYVVFPRFPKFINSRIIGYIWSSNLPEETVLKNRKNPMAHYIVVRSGNKNIGEWVEDNRNVLEDYRKIYAQDPPKVGGVSLMIDSDDTRSSAESYFARIVFKN